MGLYIRLYNNFWTHRKTSLLRSLIGEEALWIVPRLWSYASENQPDGDFSRYKPEVLASLLGCPDKHKNLLQSLIESGFMEKDMKLHNWSEWNGFHSSYRERSRKATEARRTARGLPPVETTEKPEKQLPLTEIPLSLNDSIFKKAWLKWLAYAAENGRPLREMSQEEKLAELKALGPVEAARWINGSIANGWQGIHNPTGDRKVAKLDAEKEAMSKDLPYSPPQFAEDDLSKSVVNLDDTQVV